MERVVQPHPGESEGLRLEEGRQKSQQSSRNNQAREEGFITKTSSLCRMVGELQTSVADMKM